MAFRDALKKHREAQGYQAPASNTSTEDEKKNGSEPSVKTGTSFRDKLKKYREEAPAKSLQDWGSAAYTFLLDIQNNTSKWHGETEYQSRYDRSTKLLGAADTWRKQYAGNEEAISYINSVVEAITEAQSHEFSTYQYFTKWGTEENYIKGATENWQQRQQRYESNKKRIEELEAERKQADAGQSARAMATGVYIPSDRVKEIDAEIDRLKAENEQYERGEGGWAYKASDDNYAVTYKGDFDAGSSKRDYTPPTREAFAQYDAYADSSTWYWDADGVGRDAYGNVLAVDENGNWYNPKAEGFHVQDKLGLYLGTSDQERQEAAGYTLGTEGTWASIIKDGMDGSWEYLTETEVGIYYYYLSQSQERADQYLSEMKTELNRRATLDAAGKWDEAYEDATFLEKIAMNIATVPAKFISNIAGGIENAAYTLTGQDLNPYSAAQGGMHFSQSVRGNTAEELDKTGFKIPVVGFTLGDLYQTGMSRLDSFVQTAMFGGFGTIFLGMGAAQEEAYNLYQKGASAEQITLGAFAAGAAEAIWEYVSFGKLQEIKDVDTLGKWVKSILIQGANEASEEALTEVSNMITNALVMGSQSNLAEMYKENEGKAFRTFVDILQQVAHSAFGGFIGGVGAGFGQSTGVYIDTTSRYRQVGRDVMGAKGGANALLDLAMKKAGASTGDIAKSLTEQAGKVSTEIATGKGLKKVGAAMKNRSNATKIGRLYNTVLTADTAANQADIAKSLQRKGFSAETANDIAEALVAEHNGLELTDIQKKLLQSAKGNKVVQEAISSIMENEKSTMGQRSQQMRDFREDVRVGKVVSATGLSKDAAKQLINIIDNKDKRTTAETAYDGSYNVSSEGKAVLDGKEVKLDGLRMTGDGAYMVATTDGQTADGSEVTYPSNGHALVYEGYLSLEDIATNPVVADMSIASRNALAKAYDLTPGANGKAYFMGANQAYWYGYEGLSMDENTLPKNSPIRSLSEEQRAIAYEEGMKAGKKAKKTQSAAIEAATEAAVKKLGGKKAASNAAKKNPGMVVMEDGIQESTMTKKQKASKDMAEVVAKAIGKNVHIYHGMQEYGKYDPATGEIWLNINGNFKGSSMMAFALSHELVHMAKQWSPADYDAFAKYLVKQYAKKGVSVETLVLAQMQNARDNGYELDEHEAYEEVIADACARMLLDSDALQKMAGYREQNPDKWQQIVDTIKKFINNVRKAFKGAEPDALEAALFKEFDDAVKNELEKKFVTMVMNASEHMTTIHNAFGKDTVVEVNADGEFTLAKGEVGGEMKFLYNDSTWERGGRDTLKAALKAEGFSKEDIDAALTIMDGKHKLVKELAKKFPEQARINKATITTDLKDGHSVLSALVSNGDYPVNIDLLMVCKKRKAYQRVINRLCETGLIQQATVDALAIAEINKILGKYGFETACLGCFVESRRLRIQEWAETIVKEWNSEVKKRNPNAKAFGFGKGEATLTQDEVMQLVGELEGHEKNDKGNLNLGQGSAVKRMGVLLDKVPSLRKTLTVEDLITPDGLTALRQYDSNLFSMVKSRYGSNSPKFVQEFNPYNHELAIYGKVPTEYESLREYLYAIGGARMQSFSDFIVENWFDYCQIVADLAARKLPMHTYTKEISLAKLFGLTGIKINMSLIPDIDRSLGKEYAGLTRNANGELELIWADKDRYKATGGKSYMQSINFADAIALQSDPRYSANVGTIAVGVSDQHILMMLDDARIRMIIPYHSSGMNPIFADLMGTSFYNDYTMVQNTRVKQLYNSKGQKVSVKLDKTQTAKLTGGFQFNAVLQELGDARAAAEAYKEWCADASKHTITINGQTYTAELTPKFDAFANHQNYYKLLEDFNTYDCISEQAAPQGDVQQVYPENFDQVLKAELKAQETHRQKQIADQAFDKAMGEIEAYLGTHTKADTVFYAEQHGIKLNAKDKKLGAEDKKKLAGLRKGMKMSMPKVDSQGKQLSAEQQEFFKDSVVVDVDGKLLVMYHGTNSPYFTIFDPKVSDDQISLFFTSDPEVANTYTNLQDSGKDVDVYNLITEDSTAEQFNAAQKKLGGGIRIVKITDALVNEMRQKASKGASELLADAQKVVDLLKRYNSGGEFTKDIAAVQAVLDKGAEATTAADIIKLREAINEAENSARFLKNGKEMRQRFRALTEGKYNKYGEVISDKLLGNISEDAIGKYTYTEKTNWMPTTLPRDQILAGKLTPMTEREAVAKAIDRSKWTSENTLGNRYKVYLNITNPYVIDAGIDYSGKMDRVSLEYSYTTGMWTVSFENADYDERKHMSKTDFMAFVESAFDADTAARIKAHIESDNEAYLKEWGDLDPEYVDHNIQLTNVDMAYIEPGKWNQLRDKAVAEFMGYLEDDAPVKTRDVAKFAKAKGYDGVIFKNMKDAGGYAATKGRGGSTVVTAFSSEQVKSVDNKKPTTNPDMRYSMPKVIKKPTDNKYIKMVEDGATHIGEYDVVPESKQPKKTILAWKALVVKPGAKNNPKDKGYGNMYPPQVHQVASTPYGVWLYANNAPMKLDKDGNPELTKFGRPKVKEGMTYRPAWHFGDAPYASQFKTSHGFFDDNGVQRFYMAESKGILVWALCEMAADESYQDEADMAGHVGEDRVWDEQQASLWYLPENGYYKYMTNRVDPNSVTWYLSDKMRIVQTITDAEMRDILTWIKEDGSTDLEFNYPLRLDGKDVNPADYGIPVGNVVGDGIDYVDRWKNQFREIAMNGDIDITQSHFYYVPSTATNYGSYETVSFSKEVDDHSQELLKTKKDAKILTVNPSSKSVSTQSFESSTGVKVKEAQTMDGRKKIIEAARKAGYDIVEFAKAGKGLGVDVVIVNPDSVIRNYEFNNVSERHGRTDAVKYAMPKVKSITPSEADIQQNMETIALMKPVHAVDASKLERTGKKPSVIFTEHFDSWGWNIHSEELGDIEITPQSVRDEVRHGITAVKIASTEAIPSVIRDGKIIFAGQKPGTTVYRIVVCAPITIGKSSYYMGVMLQRDSNAQRLYLHNVVIEEETTTLSPAVPLTTGADESNDRLFITNILQDALSVKYDMRIGGKNKAPNARGMSPRQLLADAFDELVQSPKEREKMDEYRNNIAKVEEVQERLRKLRGEISKLTKAKGDKAKIDQMNKTAAELTDLIDKYDRKLLELEASKPLRDVLARARSAAIKEARESGEKALKEYRQQVSDRIDRIVDNKRKTDMRKKIRKTIRDLDKILNRGDKKRNVKEDMKDFVAEALSAAEVLFTDNYTNEDIIRNGFGVELSKDETRYFNEVKGLLDEIANLPAGSYDAWQARQEAEAKLKSKLEYRMSKLKDAFFRERQRLNKTEVAEVLGKLADAYARLENSEYAYVNGAYHESVHQYLKMLQEEMGGAKVKDMTLGQLENLYKAYTMVLTTVKNANKMFAEDLKQSKEELANRVMMEVYQAGGEHGLWTKGQLARNQYSWNNTKPIYAAERTGSSTFVKLFNGLFKGQYNWAVDMAEAKAFRKKIAEKYGFKSWDMEKTYKFTSTSGIDFELNLNQIMALYAYAKREQAHDHLLKGGFVFGKNTEVVVTKNGIKRTYLNKSAKAHNISDEIMGEIVSKLSKEQKGFVDEMQDYLSTTMGNKGNEVSMRLYGVKLFMEKFYFPLRSAGQFKEKAKEAELKQQQGQISIANSGFTHATTPKASNPVVLDGFTDVWASHVNEMSLYHSMVLPMEDFRRVYNYASPNMEGQESASVNSFIENAYGDAATGYFDQLYKELNGGAIVDPRESLSKQMIGKFKKSAVLLSNSVWVQQFSAIGRALALVDLKHFVGAKVDKQKHASLWEEVKKYSPVAIIKEMGGFDTHTGLSAKDYLLAEEYGKGERVKGLIKDEQYREEIMGWAPSMADEMTWCAIWEAVKRETKAQNPGMDVKSEAFLQKAGERFSEVIEKTQVYDSVLARSANMRSKNGLMQMLTAFMAEPTTTVNMVEDALRKGNKKYIARTLGSVVASVILNNALASLVYGMRDDDEDETFLEKYAQAFTSGMLDDLNPMTYYPILKDIWSLFQGYDIERSDMAIYSDIADAIKKVVTLLAKDNGDMDEDALAEHNKEIWGAIMGLVDAGASAFGIPWKNVRRDFASYFNTIKTFSRAGTGTWNSFVDAIGGAALDSIPVVGLVAGRSKTDKLYDAIVSGDATYVKRLRAGYDDEKSYNLAVRKALRENDPRIHDAAVARMNGDLATYTRIAKAIIAEGHFSQDIVVAAINTEINAIDKGEATASTPKASGLYTADDFAVAIANGDAAMANAIKADIIKTAQKNGKTEEEAEKGFVSSAAAACKELFLDGEIGVDQAIDALVTFCGKTEDGAMADVQYWAFKQDYPDVYVDDQWFDTYYEKVASSGLPIDVYMDYRNKVSTITGEGKKEKRMAVINSLPITKAQKDALYYAEGWTESKIHEAPWH